MNETETRSSPDADAVPKGVPLSDAQPPRLRLDHLSRHFGGIRALEDVSFEIGPGTIHALLGENGAGKSTLVKTVTGVHPPSAGQVLLDGRAVSFASPMDARAAGVVAVYQDPKLFPHFDVAENIFMGIHPTSSLGLVDRRRMYDLAQALLDALDAGLDARQPALGLSIGQSQFVEFARATTAGDARLLFLDEPTAALTPTETDRLCRLVRRLRERGTTIVFISHRIEEIEGFVDGVTVLRDGRHVATLPAEGLTQGEIIRLMVGRELEHLYVRRSGAVELGPERLTVEGLGSSGAFSGVSFSVHGGEVVAMAGLVGAGRSEIAQAIMGLRETAGGRVLVDGKEVTKRSPQRMQLLGVAHLPEDRDSVGLVTTQPVATNISLAVLDRVSRLGVILFGRERTLARHWVDELQIKARSVDDPVSTLSGGNRQKVVLGKWLALNPGVLILDEPTHGIDVGTKAQVHKIIADLAAEGIAVLVISSDLPEVLGVGDRILVIHEGRLAASFARNEATEEAIMAAATSGRRSAA